MIKPPQQVSLTVNLSSGEKGKQEGKFHSAISFPLVVRDDPSSATPHSKIVGTPKCHSMRSNNAHQATSGTSVSQRVTEK